MKKSFLGVIVILLILVIVIIINNYPEKGRVEEVIYSKYEYKDKFIRMEIYGEGRTKEATDTNSLDKLTSYLKDIEVKEKYFNTDLEGTSDTYFIYLTNESGEWLSIHINGKLMDVMYETSTIKHNMKKSHKKYFITDEDFDIEKIEEIYTSIENNK
ncbi:hypothetical protein GOQ27_07490 [Clostridium sp. D2Q-11]|uniref:Uncharacterized protein n=1 Tax=Anaeromonas frigoriresistens TaxID=2683708 RepID=A0A942UZ93_9FIRM|nr:hypothetical protein [Anaeromonas frigoriresistens]MBS4538302.1 hypothetical protein [Anaeromonas frigoriresistens]